MYQYVAVYYTAYYPGVGGWSAVSFTDQSDAAFCRWTDHLPAGWEHAELFLWEEPTPGVSSAERGLVRRATADREVSLLPCPFCGRDAGITELGMARATRRWRINCSTCKLTKHHAYRDDLIAWWNGRNDGSPKTAEDGP
jgi:hypothetical protein